MLKPIKNILNSVFNHEVWMYCKHCGVEYDARYEYCEECGHRN